MIFTCKNVQNIFRIYTLLTWWLNSFVAKINIHVYDRDTNICLKGNNVSKAHKLESAIVFNCEDILNISPSAVANKDIYICWKSSASTCFALKLYMCALFKSSQVKEVNRFIILYLFLIYCYKAIVAYDSQYLRTCPRSNTLVIQILKTE